MFFSSFDILASVYASVRINMMGSFDTSESMIPKLGLLSLPTDFLSLVCSIFRRSAHTPSNFHFRK